jgi:hypothetical protein
LAVYVAAWATFHLGEFWVTAGWNPDKLSVDGESCVALLPTSSSTSCSSSTSHSHSSSKYDPLINLHARFFFLFFPFFSFFSFSFGFAVPQHSY